MAIKKSSTTKKPSPVKPKFGHPQALKTMYFVPKIKASSKAKGRNGKTNR